MVAAGSLLVRQSLTIAGPVPVDSTTTSASSPSMATCQIVRRQTAEAIRRVAKEARHTITAAPTANPTANSNHRPYSGAR